MDNDEDLEEIFADYEEIKNDENGGDASNEQTDANGAESSQAVAVAVRKRIVRNPRPKLNAERLCGERGIPALGKHFEKVSFKQGKGYEKENLDKLMCNLEHWAHRLFPSLKFSESLIHIEKLGKKKPVQVCVKKLRLDMPILSEDFVHDPEDDADDVHRQSEVEKNYPPESTFDQLMKEHRETFPQTSDIVEDSIVATFSPVAGHCDPVISPPKSVTLQQELTEEQRQRIERNKMLAAERRKAKLDATRSFSASDVNHSISSPPKHSSSNILHDNEIVHDAHPQCMEPLLTNKSDEVSATESESLLL